MPKTHIETFTHHEKVPKGVTFAVESEYTIKKMLFRRNRTEKDLFRRDQNRLKHDFRNSRISQRKHAVWGIFVRRIRKSTQKSEYSSRLPPWEGATRHNQ